MSMRMRWLVRELPQLNDRHVRIADIGCGDGQFLEFLKARGYDHVAASSRIVAGTQRSNTGRTGVASREEAEAAGLLKEAAEILFVWHVLEHIERPTDFIEEYSRWLAPSGVMVISVPNQASIANPFVRLFVRLSRLWTPYLVSHHGLSQLVRANVPALDAKILRDATTNTKYFPGWNSIASAIMRKAKFRSPGAQEGRGRSDATACCRLDGYGLVAAGGTACAPEHTCRSRKHADLCVAACRKAFGQNKSRANQ